MNTMRPIMQSGHWNRLKLAMVGVGLVSLSLANPVLAQEKTLRTLTVTGREIELVTTTLSQIRLGVEAQGQTADVVQQEVARRSTAVVTLLRSRNVEKLQTTGINLSPTYRYENGMQTLTGYAASNMVSFRIETAKAGELLDAAVKAGASRIDGISFVASDAAIAAAQKEALRGATQNAQSQADVVLNALNLTRHDIVSIQINGSFMPPPRPFEALGLQKSGAAVPVPVIGGEQQVEASVTLQVSY